jgi:predicted nucleotidyltransferase
MNILKVNYEHTVRQKFGTSIEALERAFNRFGIDYYLIGAFVREVWTDHIAGLPEKRVTRDLDFAVFISNHDQYEALKKHLITKEKFAEHEEPYRLLTQDGNIIDLIPFGGIEKNSEVYLTGHKAVHLSVFGTKEVTANAQVIEGNFKVITLPGLAVMKLVAWYESTDRSKDLEDFYYLLMNYSNMATDDLYKENNLDLLETCFEVRFAGARLLAREIKTIIKDSDKLNLKIIEIMDHLLENFSFHDIDEMYKVNEPSDKHILRLKFVKESLEELNRN